MDVLSLLAHAFCPQASRVLEAHHIGTAHLSPMPIPSRPYCTLWSVMVRRWRACFRGTLPLASY